MYVRHYGVIVTIIDLWILLRFWRCNHIQIIYTKLQIIEKPGSTRTTNLTKLMYCPSSGTAINRIGPISHRSRLCILFVDKKILYIVNCPRICSTKRKIRSYSSCHIYKNGWTKGLIIEIFFFSEKIFWMREIYRFRQLI